MTTADDYVIQFIQDKGLVSPADVSEARAASAPVPDGQNADTVAIAKLVETGKVAWPQITAALSKEFDMELIDVSQVSPSDDILKLISREQAEARNILPLQMDGAELLVAISDPLDTETLDSVSGVLKLPLNPRLAPPDALKEAISRCYSGGPISGGGAYNDILGKGGDDGLAVELPQGGDVKEDDAPIIRYVNSLIVDAIRRKASDIHLEPLEKRFRVRFPKGLVRSLIKTAPREYVQHARNPANNVIPARGSATVNIRFNDAHSGTSIADWLRAEAAKVEQDTGVTIATRIQISGESFLTPPGDLSALISRAVQAETGVTPELSTTGGTSDARFVKDHCPVVEFGLVGKTMHAVDERVSVDQIGQLKAIYRRILEGYFA